MRRVFWYRMFFKEILKKTVVFYIRENVVGIAVITLMGIVNRRIVMCKQLSIVK